jgi:4-hydroxybenzoate polyprenyltransferase
MITVFAGYTCIYALNDVTDCEIDRQRMGELPTEPACFDLDCLSVRHPLAQGLISYAGGVTWTVSWGVVALVGAALLNPVCAVIFVVGAILEVIYCRLYQMSQWKILIAATVKNLGAMAAIFAVNPEPSVSFVLMVFFWIAAWEVGGQNIPNDLMDMQEDGKLGAKTVPVVYGVSTAVMLLIITLVASFVFGLALVLVSPLAHKAIFLIGGILSGVLFLLLPLRSFLASGDTNQAIKLFNKASLYPLGILTTTVLCLILQSAIGW